MCLVTQSCPTLQPHVLGTTRLLCPWDSPGKNTGVGCHALLQGIFLPQGSNQGLLHCRQILNQLSYQGSPHIVYRIDFWQVWLIYYVGYTGSIPGSGRSPGEGNGNPLQYSCLENSMDGGAWWATVHGGHKESDTTERLHFLSFSLTGLAEGTQLETSLVVQWLELCTFTAKGPRFHPRLGS